MASNTLVVLALTLTLTLATLFSSATPTYVCSWCLPAPTPPTPPPPSSGGTCPIGALKLGVCAGVLGGLINATIGHTPDGKCCPLIAGLADFEATACLCIALKANVFGINAKIPLYLPFLLNYCGKDSSSFKCP